MSCEFWDPRQFSGATDDFKNARVRECCAILGRSLFTDDNHYLSPRELIHFVPAISSMITTILFFRGISPGAFAYLLKDAVISYKIGQRESSAMFIGVAERFLDYYFATIRHWGNEKLVQSFFQVFWFLQKQLAEDKVDNEYVSFVGRFAQFIVPGGLFKVPSVPDAKEHFFSALKPINDPIYFLGWDGKFMSLLQNNLQTKESKIISQVSVCTTTDEFIERIWEQIASKNLKGPIDRNRPLTAPSLGDFGISSIWRTKAKSIIGEVVCPIYAANFEYPISEESHYNDFFIIVTEKKEEISAIGYDANEDQFCFELIIRYADRSRILEGLPGIGGNLTSKRKFKEESIQMNSVKLNTFIVHGRSDTLKLELKNYLWSTLGLPEPIILHEQPNLGRVIIEKFEEYANQPNLVFVLLTPDDIGSLADDTNDKKRRARQNVIFELGYFLGKLTRQSGRVILLYKSPLELPSDIAGITYIDVSLGIKAAGEDIRNELKHIIK